MREQSHVCYVLLIGIIAAIIIRNFINVIAKRRTNHTIAVRPEAAHSLATVYYASRRNVWAFICTIYFLRRSLFVFLIWMRFDIKVYKKYVRQERLFYTILCTCVTSNKICYRHSVLICWISPSLHEDANFTLQKKKQR